MNKTILILTTLLINVVISAQVPNSFRYQAVIRNADGSLMSNKNVGIRISIIKGDILGVTAYMESHNTKSNDYGIVALQIGDGTPELNSMADINWSNGLYFIKIEIDPQGGNNYILASDPVQLLSVPYALYALNAGNIRTVTEPVDMPDEEPIFKVVNKQGEVVFAVFNNGVTVTVDEGIGKGGKGGFAVGSRNPVKGTSEDFFIATPDSVQILLSETSVKGGRGGFAVSGRSAAKSPRDYLTITPAHTNFYIRTDSPTEGSAFNIYGTDQGNTPRALLQVSKDTLIMEGVLNVRNNMIVQGNIDERGSVSALDTLTIFDLDGNKYKTITIGSQLWMAENLKTTHFNDGSPIPNVSDSSSWRNSTSPAYCWYNNDGLTNKNFYGALYNGYAIITNKLCPTGWHVPTDSNWMALELSLGISQSEIDQVGVRGDINVANSIKSTFGWTAGLNGTNSSGFNAIPAGLRSGGGFYYLTSYSDWWSSTANTTNQLYIRELGAGDTGIIRGGIDYEPGLSVRCISD